MPGPKPKQLRFSTERGEFSAPETRREALEREGAKVLDKPAVDGNGDPLPFKPKKLRRSPGGQEGATERTPGQMATTADFKEKV